MKSQTLRIRKSQNQFVKVHDVKLMCEQSFNNMRLVVGMLEEFLHTRVDRLVIEHLTTHRVGVQ